MGGETEASVSGWTVDTLASHIQRQIHDLKTLLDERYDTQTKALDAARIEDQRGVAAALASAEKAVSKAETAAEKRFDGVNEFRQLVTDLVREQMPRVEAEQRLAAISEKIDDLKTVANLAAGRHAQFGDTRLNLGTILGGMSVVLVLVFGVLTVLSR